MELRHLRYFAALARTLHFTRAAELSHVTQSTLSHSIKTLENELATRLFDRIGKRVQITEAGDALLEHILPALQTIDLAINALQAPPHSMVGTIRVGATHSFANHLVPQCVASFCQRNPELRVSIEELAQGEIIAKLEAGELDLGIAYRSDNQRQIWFKPLYTEELVLVVSSKHPLAKRRSVRMTELNNVRMTLFPPQYTTRALIDQCLRDANAVPEVVVELNTVRPMLELIRRSELAGIVGGLSVPKDAGIAVLGLENPTPMRSPGLLWKRGAPDTPAIKQFAMMVMRAVEAKGLNTSRGALAR